MFTLHNQKPKQLDTLNFRKATLMSQLVGLLPQAYNNTINLQHLYKNQYQEKIHIKRIYYNL